MSEEFNIDIYAKCLSFEDVYGGKLCAALDRQHPRDLFDVKLLLARERITENIRHSFLVYLISGNRPINEMLMPNHKNIGGIYEADFKDMVNTKITLEELVQARAMLGTALMKSLNNDDRAFLKSFVRNTSDWHLVKHSKIKEFPAVRWKLLNQQKMSKEKNISMPLTSCFPSAIKFIHEINNKPLHKKDYYDTIVASSWKYHPTSCSY